MSTFDEALRLVLEHIGTVGTESVDIAEACGRLLAEEIVAPWNLPLFDNSAMDGYAVRTVDCQEPPVRLRLTGLLLAGSVPSSAVEPGCAIKIMTGAPIPPGCDAVVAQEQAVENGESVEIGIAVSQYKHIRRSGEDVRLGEKLMEPGERLRPASINMLASCGRSTVSVYRRPRVAILSLGDELLQAGSSLEAGKIIDSNGPALAAAIQEAGALPLSLGIAKDNLKEHREKITEGLHADMLLTSGGASVGTRDLVREVLADFGVEHLFTQVEMRPGAPTCFGLHGTKPVFSLPGNPVASLVAFEELVRPGLRKMMGYRWSENPRLTVVMQEEVRKKPGRVQFLRVRLVFRQGKYLAWSAGNQNTGILKTFLCADALVLLPSECTLVSPGDELQAHLTGQNGEVPGFCS